MLSSSKKALSPTTRLALASVSLLALSACSVNDPGNFSGSFVGSPNSVGTIVGSGGSSAGSVGQAVSNIGNTIGSTEQLNALLGSEGTAALGGTVVSLGGTVGSVGGSLSSGLGMSGATTNPVSGTTDGLTNTTTGVQTTVGSASTLVNAIGSGDSPLAPLNPVTSAVSSGLNTVNDQVVGTVVGGVNGLLTDQLDALTTPLDGLATPLTNQISDLGEGIGLTTGLNEPIGDAVMAIGGGLDQVGAAITGSGAPVVSELGAPVTMLGDTVGTLDVLLSGNGSTGTIISNPEGIGLLEATVFNINQIGTVLGAEEETNQLTATLAGAITRTAGMATALPIPLP